MTHRVRSARLTHAENTLYLSRRSLAFLVIFQLLHICFHPHTLSHFTQTLIEFERTQMLAHKITDKRLCLTHKDTHTHTHTHTLLSL